MDKSNLRGFDEWERTRFLDLYDWRRQGGIAGEEPYFDEIDGGRRVFIDALIFPTWAEWKRQRDKALAAALYGDGGRRGIGSIFTDNLPPLSPRPLYLLERKYQTWHPWLNACIATEEAFAGAFVDAHIAIDKQERFDREHRGHGELGDMLTLAFAERPPFDGTQYDSCLNETDDAVSELFLAMTKKIEGGAE